MRKQIYVIFLAALLFASFQVVNANKTFSYKIQCVKKIQGCKCYTRPAQSQNNNAPSRIVYHMQAAQAVKIHNKKTATTLQRLGLVKIKSKHEICYYPKSSLKKYFFHDITSSRWQQKLDHTPLPLSRLLKKKNPRSLIGSHHKIKLGVFWPTYYHLALEDFHPGKKINIKTPRGKTIGTASKDFLQQVTWEGSGISSTGLRLHYSGSRMRFRSYSKKIWGYGAGHAYTVSPYRTIAVNFKGLCRVFGFKKCRKSRVIGSLVWIENIAKKKISMSDGSIHDGYFCATDTGSPNYIKKDRIDMFVGVHGGGNPYLPKQRRGNYFYNAGFKSLVPSDWRLWKTSKSRVWCSFINGYDAKTGIMNKCFHDYHTTARHKALRLYGFLDGKGRPLKCHPGF